VIETRLNLQIASEAGSQTGTCLLNLYTQCDALKYSARVIGIIWGMTAILSIVPIIRVVVIPGGIITGLILGAIFYRRIRGKTTVTEGRSRCPKCLRELIFSFKETQHQMESICRRCGCCYKVELMNECLFHSSKVTKEQVCRS
jgi:hypothetical protein